MNQAKAHSPHAVWSVAVFVLALAGCGDGNGNGKAQSDTQTAPIQAEQTAPPDDAAKAKIAQLEASGALPRLDRSPTVEGIDANSDGVRDDIALHIIRTYTDPAQRKTAMQTARAYQRMLLVDKNDAVALEATSQQMMRAIACEGTVFRGSDGLRQGTEMANDVRAITTNTKDRLQAYLAYNKARSGSVSLRLEGDNCE